MILDPLDIPDELLEAQEQGVSSCIRGRGCLRGAPSDLPDFAGLAVSVAKGTQFEKELSARSTNAWTAIWGDGARWRRIQHLVRERMEIQPHTRPICTAGFSIFFPTKGHPDRNHQFRHALLPAYSPSENFSATTISPRRCRWAQFSRNRLPYGSLLREDDPLVLSDEDFGRAYMIEGWARDFLRGMFDTYTTLFIGYSHIRKPSK